MEFTTTTERNTNMDRFSFRDASYDMRPARGDYVKDFTTGRVGEVLSCDNAGFSGIVAHIRWCDTGETSPQVSTGKLTYDLV